MLKKTTIYILAPSLAHFDNTKEILLEIKDKMDLILFIPSYKILEQIDFSSELGKRLYDQGFHKIIFQPYTNGAIVYNNFKSLFFHKKILKFLKPIVKLEKRYKKSAVTNFISVLLTTRNKLKKINNDYFKDQFILTIGDLSQVKYVNDLTNYLDFRDSTFLHISHGINPKVQLKISSNIYIKSCSELIYTQFSRYDRSIDVDAIKIKKTKFIDVGIPRHEFSHNDYFQNDTSNVLLITRPHTSNYFQKTDKDYALSLIVSLAVEKKLKIFLKLHPKEVDRKYYLNFFKHIQFNNWEFTNEQVKDSNRKYSHALLLHDSEVQKDLIIMGIPTTIVMSDSVFNKWIDNPFIKTSNSSTVIDIFRDMYNISSDYRSLNKSYINRESLIAAQKKAYDLYYNNPQGSTNKILQEINK